MKQKKEKINNIEYEQRKKEKKRKPAPKTHKVY